MRDKKKQISRRRRGKGKISTQNRETKYQKFFSRSKGPACAPVVVDGDGDGDGGSNTKLSLGPGQALTDSLSSYYTSSPLIAQLSFTKNTATIDSSISIPKDRNGVGDEDRVDHSDIDIQIVGTSAPENVPPAAVCSSMRSLFPGATTTTTTTTSTAKVCDNKSSHGLGDQKVMKATKYTAVSGTKVITQNLKASQNSVTATIPNNNNGGEEDIGNSGLLGTKNRHGDALMTSNLPRLGSLFLPKQSLAKESRGRITPPPPPILLPRKCVVGSMDLLGLLGKQMYPGCIKKGKQKLHGAGDSVTDSIDLDQNGSSSDFNDSKDKGFGPSRGLLPEISTSSLAPLSPRKSRKKMCLESISADILKNSKMTSPSVNSRGGRDLAAMERYMANRSLSSNQNKEISRLEFENEVLKSKVSDYELAFEALDILYSNADIRPHSQC
ncbi:hypothetical protein H4219_004868 [Mycoemilia scoparia]|uniref:Uncharacterized protein n=1 Tax=Mycoemilia scoparia TaxID=417184 RepID=A0A9W8DKU6_9FUNG|nr:hypothetical protein H4219_004868 [Mycoemilia scoparia]